MQKIMEIDDHIGCAMSGLTADAKMLVDHARAETQVRHFSPCAHKHALYLTTELIVSSQQHRFTYNEPMPVESCTQSLCDLALRFGEDGEAGMVRRHAWQLLPAAFDVVLPAVSTIRRSSAAGGMG